MNTENVQLNNNQSTSDKMNLKTLAITCSHLDLQVFCVYSISIMF